MPPISSLRWPRAYLSRLPRNLNMSLAPSKKWACPSFQVTTATQLGYFETSMPQTGQRSRGPGFGISWAPANGAAAARKSPAIRLETRFRKERRCISTLPVFLRAATALFAVPADHGHVAGHVEIGFTQRIVEIAGIATVPCLEFLGRVG